MAADQALNAYAIGVVVRGEEQLIALGKRLKQIGVDVDRINKKVAGAGGGTPAKTVSDNKKVEASHKTRAKTVTAAQRAEQKSMRNTTFRLNSQSASFEKYNRKIAASARLNKNEITDMFRRVALWSTGVGVLFGTLSKVKFIFGAVKDLEVQMTELKKVMDDDTAFKNAQRQLLQTALSMSVTATQAAEVAKVWAQQGKSAAEVATLTRISLLGVNAANLTATQSVEFLTSAMKSFNLEANRTENAIDSIMAIQADFAITSQNLAKGMQVAGAITAQLGGDMNELFGMMTAIGEVTRETGNVIGNSLKTQLARIQQPRTIAFLERFGIAVRRMTDEGVVRRLSAFEIFRQIADKRKAGTLTQDQVLDIAIKIGGIRKFKDALVLIENFGTATEAFRTGFLAYGDAASASALTQDTLEKKLTKLNTAFVDLGASVSELGTLEGVKGIVSFVTNMVTGLSSIAQGNSFLGGAGQAAFQALPLAIIGGFTKFLGKRVFQNVRGTELRELEEFANVRGTPLTRTQAATQYKYFGKESFGDKNFSKLINKEMSNMRSIAKKAGSSVSLVTREMAMMNVMSKQLKGGMGGLAGTFGTLGKRARLAGRSMLAGAGYVPRSQQATFQQLGGGTGTARIFSSLGGLLKGALGAAAIIAVFEGGIKFFEYLQSLRPKEINYKDVIDQQSQASLAFADLAKSLVSVKDEAKRAGESLEGYAKNLSFQEKVQKLQGPTEALGVELVYGLFKGLNKAVPKFNEEAFKEFAKTKGIRAAELPQGEELEKFYDKAFAAVGKGTIDNLAQLKKALIARLGVDEKDIPTEEFARVFQQALRNMVRFEFGGKFQQTIDETNKNLGEFLDKIRENIAENFTDFEKASPTTSEGFLRSTSTGGRPEGVQFITATGKLGDVMETLVTGIVNNSDKFTKAFEEANITLDLENLADAFNIKEGELAAASLNKMFATIDDLGTEFGNVPSVQDMLSGFLDDNLGTRETFNEDIRKKLLDAGTTEAEARKENALVIARITAEARARITKYLDELSKADPALRLALKGYEREFNPSLNAVSSAAREASYAMIKTTDEIFKATSEFVSNIEKISVKDSLSGILGTGTSTAQDAIKAFREYATSTSQIASGFRSKRRVEENTQERLTDFIAKYDADLVDLVKGVAGGTKTSDEAFAALSEFRKVDKSDPSSDRRKSINETERLVADLIKVQRQEALLRAELSGATTSWANLIDLAKNTFGVNIAGEVELKSAFEQISTTGSIEEFAAIFQKLIDGMMESAVDEIAKVDLDKLSVGYQQQANKLSSYATRFYKTGVDITDAQISATIAAQQSLNDLNIEADTIRRQLGDPTLQGSIDREKLLARLELIEAEKAGNKSMNELAVGLERMAIEADKITDATDTARSAFTQFFADVKKFDPNTNAASFAIEDALNQIANARLEKVGEDLANQLLAGFEGVTGSQFGEFLLGEEIQDPLNMNTDALSINTMSLNDLSFKLSTMLGLGVGGSTGSALFGGFDNIVSSIGTPGIADNPLDTAKKIGEMDLGFSTGGEFARKARELEERVEQISTIFDSGGKKVEINLKELAIGLGQIAGGIFGNLAADAAGKQGNAVNIGTSLGGAAGTQWLTGLLGSFAGPLGSIFGGILGGLFGRDKEEEEDSKNLKQVAENTAALVALDSRIINAPADFVLPSSANQGGSVQWTGNIIINGADGNTAQTVVNEVNKIMGRGTSTYNVVNDRLL